MLNKAFDVLQYKPVQVGLKTFAVGSLIGLGMYAWRKVSPAPVASKSLDDLKIKLEQFHASRDTGLDSEPSGHSGRGSEPVSSKDFNAQYLKDLFHDLDTIWHYDPEWIDLLNRLETFRRFGFYSFDIVIRDLSMAYVIMNAEKIPSTTASQSFRVRREFQKVIESMRLFRAVVETQVPIEDFDEIAVDFNALADKMCTEAIQNTYA